MTRKDNELDVFLDKFRPVDRNASGFRVTVTVFMNSKELRTLEPYQAKEVIEHQIKFKLKQCSEEFNIKDFEAGRSEW